MIDNIGDRKTTYLISFDFLMSYSPWQSLWLLLLLGGGVLYRIWLLFLQPPNVGSLEYLHSYIQWHVGNFKKQNWSKIKSDVIWYFLINMIPKSTTCTVYSFWLWANWIDFATCTSLPFSIDFFSYLWKRYYQCHEYLKDLYKSSLRQNISVQDRSCVCYNNFWGLFIL